jgi:hypothetical protein
MLKGIKRHTTLSKEIFCKHCGTVYGEIYYEDEDDVTWCVCCANAKGYISSDECDEDLGIGDEDIEYDEYERIKLTIKSKNPNTVFSDRPKIIQDFKDLGKKYGYHLTDSFSVHGFECITMVKNTKKKK